VGDAGRTQGRVCPEIPPRRMIVEHGSYRAGGPPAAQCGPGDAPGPEQRLLDVPPTAAEVEVDVEDRIVKGPE